MSKDIGPVLEGWEYEPGKLKVRKVQGVDGNDKIQIRLDLGLYQLEVAGRPDGRKPHGAASLLDHYLSILEEHQEKYGTDKSFKLDKSDGVALSSESMQYYHRRISWLAMGEYEKAIEDADHNLQIMNLKRDYATDEEERLSAEQYRAFVLMQRTQAHGLLHLQRKDYEGALAHIDRGISEIETFFQRYHQEGLIENSTELSFLQGWREEIARNKPLTLRERLEKQLRVAVEKEQFERAAELRDRIHNLEEE